MLHLQHCTTTTRSRASRVHQRHYDHQLLANAYTRHWTGEVPLPRANWATLVTLATGGGIAPRHSLAAESGHISSLDQSVRFRSGISASHSLAHYTRRQGQQQFCCLCAVLPAPSVVCFHCCRARWIHSRYLRDVSVLWRAGARSQAPLRQLQMGKLQLTRSLEASERHARCE